MKTYSNGRDTTFDAAKSNAAKGEDAIVSKDTKSGPASLQNRSIRRIVAFRSTISSAMNDGLFKSIFRDRLITTAFHISAVPI